MKVLLSLITHSNKKKNRAPGAKSLRRRGEFIPDEGDETERKINVRTSGTKRILDMIMRDGDVLSARV